MRQTETERDKERQTESDAEGGDKARVCVILRNYLA